MSTGREGAPRGIIHRGKRPHWLMTSRMKGWWLLPSHGKPLVSCGTTEVGAEPGWRHFQTPGSSLDWVFPAQWERPALSLAGIHFPTHCLLRMKASLLVLFFFFSPFQSQPWLAWFYFFFPLHLNLAPQLKNKGKVSGDWRISHRALHIRHPCFGQGSWFLRLPFWT